MVKAITFDLDGVYFTENSFSRFKNSLPVSDLTKLDFLSKSESMMSFKRGELTEDQFWDIARQEIGIDLSNQQIFELMYQAYEVNQDVVDYVKKVRSQGIKTCICTNNFPTRINAVGKKFDFLSDFDVQVFSYEVGSVKPDPKIFQTLIDRSEVLPEEIFYADDKEANVISAKSLGINAIVYTTFEDFVQKLQSFSIIV
jgi:putative hydrolase of the HAD superfamily